MGSENLIVCRTFQITPLSANNLQDLRKIFKMKVYAKATIGGNDKTEKKTKADKHSETNPRWDCPMKYTIGESAVIHHGVRLVIQLYCKRKLGDRFLRSVNTSIKELFDSTKGEDDGGSRSAVMTCPVEMDSSSSDDSKSESKKTLTFSYSFGERMAIKRPPMWKELLNSGVAVLLDVVFITTTGMSAPFEVTIFTNPGVIE